MFQNNTTTEEVVQFINYKNILLSMEATSTTTNTAATHSVFYSKNTNSSVAGANTAANSTTINTAKG